MHFDLDQRSASLSVGEFADFLVGPREAVGGSSGIWRAQLGSRWHKQLHAKEAETDAEARFEVPIQGKVFVDGWTLSLNGRIDQLLRRGPNPVLREIKTVLRPLPCDEETLRGEYPGYFLQLACYVALRKIGAEPGAGTDIPELLFVEADSGVVQAVRLGVADEAAFRAQLERVRGFLQQRWLSRERLRRLRTRPAFESFRPGQANSLGSLSAALAQGSAALIFEAPTGFGKTGIVLEAALERMKAGDFERLVYLTSKSTGQLQVVRTLGGMSAERQSGTTSGETANEGEAPLGVWLVRPKSEHCINERFHCVRDICAHMRDVAQRWEKSGLSRFLYDTKMPRDIATLREAGRSASICPYEITRAALPFSEVWIGDINYVFSPSASGLFLEQPGFVAGRTLLVVDEAHNLPARVADAYSHSFASDDAQTLVQALETTRSPRQLTQACQQWEHFLRHLPSSASLSLDEEDDARNLLEQAARLVTTTPLDYAGLGPSVCEMLWQLPSVADELDKQPGLDRHWWSPRPGMLSLTCTNAAPAIGARLREFGGVVLCSATFGPHDAYEESIGLDTPPEGLEPASLSQLAKETAAKAEDISNDETAAKPGVPDTPKLGNLTKRQTRKLFAQMTSGAELLRVEEEKRSGALLSIRAGAPWRDGAYDIGVDLRVDTSFQQRERHFSTTAITLVEWHKAAGDKRRPCAVFFPSYAYAEKIQAELEELGKPLRVAFQPRRLELAQQSEWVESALTDSDVLFLVLGSSFAEGIDLLGGRVNRALVVGPSLPEVNPIQHAKMEALERLGRDAAFRRVYQIPGMQKVNQALGRLVRAPGQKARVLLHCRRFAVSGYRELLAPEYQGGRQIQNDADLSAWLAAEF